MCLKISRKQNKKPQQLYKIQYSIDEIFDSLLTFERLRSRCVKELIHYFFVGGIFHVHHDSNSPLIILGTIRKKAVHVTGKEILYHLFSSGVPMHNCISSLIFLLPLFLASSQLAIILLPCVKFSLLFFVFFFY